MKKISTLAAGYKTHPSEVKSSYSKTPIIKDPTKIDPIDFSKKIKQWHTDGNLTTEDVNYIILQLQTIV